MGIVEGSCGYRARVVSIREKFVLSIRAINASGLG